MSINLSNIKCYICSKNQDKNEAFYQYNKEFCTHKCLKKYRSTMPVIPTKITQSFRKIDGGGFC